MEKPAEKFKLLSWHEYFSLLKIKIYHHFNFNIELSNPEPIPDKLRWSFSQPI